MSVIRTSAKIPVVLTEEGYDFYQFFHSFVYKACKQAIISPPDIHFFP
jgi:hypothetical protein